MEQQLKNSTPKKPSQDTDIPTRILKENSDLFAQFALKNYNEVITTSTVPDILKHANLRPVYKKYSRNEMQNYRHVSTFSNLSKVYEKCMFNEMETHFDNFLLKYQFKFRKRFSSQQRLVVFVEKWGKK